jgi:hypothetical protein
MLGADAIKLMCFLILLKELGGFSGGKIPDMQYKFIEGKKFHELSAGVEWNVHGFIHQKRSPVGI